MRNIVFLTVLIIGHFKVLYAQDPIFYQPYANPLYFNPAFAGTDTSQRFNFNYQWRTFSNTTYNISYDRNITGNDGIGFLANLNELGGAPINTENISIIYAHQFHINSFNVSVGIQGTYIYKHINTSNLTYGDEIDPIKGFVYTTGEELTNNNYITSSGIFDYSTGITGYGKNYFFGGSIDHITQPNEPFAFEKTNAPLHIRYTINAGFNIIIHALTITPTILYESQNSITQKVAECYFSAYHITAGIGYDYTSNSLLPNEAIGAEILTLGYQWKILRVGYTDLISWSKLTLGTNTNELSIAVLLPYTSTKLKKISNINCPQF